MARLDATKDFPSPGRGLSPSRTGADFPETGYKRLDRNILNCSASNDCGLNSDTRFRSIRLLWDGGRDGLGAGAFSTGRSFLASDRFWL